MQVDIPTDGNAARTPMVDGEPGQVNFSNNKYRFLFTFISLRYYLHRLRYVYHIFRYWDGDVIHS